MADERRSAAAGTCTEPVAGKKCLLRRARGVSKLLERYVAGQMALMRELTALYSPTINSYKRYVPGVWAPLVASWGVENRTCAIRLIGLGDPKALRVEYRQTAADINPYVAIAACLGAGLWGIEKQLELGPETAGDPGSEGPGRLPRTLREATDLLAASKAAKALFGPEFVDQYVRTALVSVLREGRHRLGARPLLRNHLRPS
jgi:glutamine synthetase